MVSLRTALVSLAAISLSSTAYAEHLRVVWSSGRFSTISGPSGGGSQSNGYSGFAIIRDDGVAIYSKADPDNHAPCYTTGSGREFTIEGDCWNQPRKFRCRCGMNANPEACEIKGKEGYTLGSGEGQQDTTFIGIAIGTDSSCVAEFDTTEGEECPPDAENNLRVTDG